MTICFFTQNNRIEKLTIPVVKFAIEKVHAVHDRSCTLDFDPDNIGIVWSEFDWVICYGSIDFINKCQNSHSLNAYVEDLNGIDYSSLTWRKELGKKMLNSKGIMLKAEKVEELLKGTFDSTLPAGKYHIRPLYIHKAFNAQAFDEHIWSDTYAEKVLDPELKCFASPIQHIHKEWRLWFVDGQIVGHSQYRQNHQPKYIQHTPTEVIEFAQKLEWLPQPCTVVDIGQVGPELKVIEFNSIHTSGWYQADIHKILQAWVGYIKHLL